jgi:hypothetical protein
MSPGKRPGIEKKEDRIESPDHRDDHPALEWATLDQLEVGEFYTLGTESPLTYLLVGSYVGRGGRTEYDVTTLVGASAGRAYTRTYWRPQQEVLVVPAEHVGDRLTASAVAFAERERHGIDRITLGSDCWPWCINDADVINDAEVVA